MRLMTESRQNNYITLVVKEKLAYKDYPKAQQEAVLHVDLPFTGYLPTGWNPYCFQVIHEQNQKVLYKLNIKNPDYKPTNGFMSNA
jgi:hypothetical protein